MIRTRQEHQLDHLPLCSVYPCQNSWAAAALPGNEVAILYWGIIPSYAGILLASYKFGIYTCSFSVSRHSKQIKKKQQQQQKKSKPFDR